MTPSEILFKPLTAAAAGSKRHAGALCGENAGAERTPGTTHVPQRLAVLPARPKSPVGKAEAAAVCGVASVYA